MKRRLLSPFAITQVLMVALIGTALGLAYWPWRWAKVRDDARARYPEVKHIEGQLLERWIAERTAAPPVLLDVRSAAEFDYSHLPGARRVTLGATLIDNKLTGLENAQLVVYDTVGFEAGAFVRSLLQRDFKNVQALEGGIYLWANDGRPLQGPGGKQVRPGAPEYRSLLDRARRAEP